MRWVARLKHPRALALVVDLVPVPQTHEGASSNVLGSAEAIGMQRNPEEMEGS